MSRNLPKDTECEVVKIGTSIPCLGYFFQIEHTVPQSFAKDSNRVGDLLNSVQRNVFLGIGICLGIALGLIMWIFCSDFYGKRITTLQTELKTEMTSLKEGVSFERAQFEMMLKSEEGERFIKEIRDQAVNELKEQVTKEAERIISEEKESIRNQLLSTKGELGAYPEGIKIESFQGTNNLNNFLDRKDIIIYDIYSNTIEYSGLWHFVIYRDKSDQETKPAETSASVERVPNSNRTIPVKASATSTRSPISTPEAIGIVALSSIIGGVIIGAAIFIDSEMFLDWCKVPLED